MKIKLPKELKGVMFSRVLMIDMNNFDIDVFLPSLFFTILAEGRGKVRNVNDPTAITRYIDELSRHSALEGFDDAEGRRVLDRLVRTALITTSGVGRAGAGEQITSIVPYSLLAHKPGFPKEGSRQRRADTFIYQALRGQFRSEEDLRDFVKRVFGRGVKINTLPMLGGEYDDSTRLDTITRLSIAFLDGFAPVAAGQKTRETGGPGACPMLAKELATDLRCYLSAYHATMPVQAFTHYLLTLINFELFSYTLKLAQAVNELVRDPAALPPAMREPAEPSAPQLYVDFTGLVNSRSQEMARACVRRDIETYQQFLYSNLVLRQLDKYVEELRRNPRRRAMIEQALDSEESGPRYLQSLLQLRQASSTWSDIEANARRDVDSIYEENINSEEEDSALVQQQLEAITAGATSDIEQVVSLLVAGQRSNAIQSFIKWYWSTGGLEKPQGILRGSLRNRRSWRYAATNDLLAVLVQLAAARLAAPQPGEDGLCIQPIRLQDFLAFLEARFGIIVDRPPAPFEDAEYIAAAHENLRAMQRRLRQMGIFRDLSDDFTVQRLHPPYAGLELTRAEGS
jgi:hypothetical protein